MQQVYKQVAWPLGARIPAQRFGVSDCSSKALNLGLLPADPTKKGERAAD